MFCVYGGCGFTNGTMCFFQRVWFYKWYDVFCVLRRVLLYKIMARCVFVLWGCFFTHGTIFVVFAEDVFLQMVRCLLCLRTVVFFYKWYDVCCVCGGCFFTNGTMFVVFADGVFLQMVRCLLRRVWAYR